MDQGGETLARQDSGASDAAESVGRALHERDETIALEDIVGGDLYCGQQLNSCRGEAL